MSITRIVRRRVLATSLSLAVVLGAAVMPPLTPTYGATFCAEWALGQKLSSTKVGAQALTDCSGPLFSMYMYLYIEHCDFGIGPACITWHNGPMVASRIVYSGWSRWTPASGLATRSGLGSGRYRARGLAYIGTYDGNFWIEDVDESIPPLP